MFPFGLAVLQKNIKMSQVYRRQMPSDGTSSHGPEPGEPGTPLKTRVELRSQVLWKGKQFKKY
jgi:hypothetical protein